MTNTIQTKFNIKSGSIIVSDPCYTKGVWCQALINNIKNGTWEAEIKKSDEGSWGVRNSELIAYHKEFEHHKGHMWDGVDADIAVDSGQAGFFDSEKYRSDNAIFKMPNFNSGREFEGDLWYDACCEVTLSDKSGGIIGNTGVVSRSGFGDGIYPLYKITDEENKVIALRLVFIDDEREEEYEMCGNCGSDYLFEEGDGEYCSHECREEDEDDE